MTKRSIFATLAALCAFAAFFCGCGHALSEQGASISIALPKELGDDMARYAMPQFAMSRQAANAGNGAGIIRIELRGDITRTEDFAWNGVEKSLTCNIDNLPVGATVTVDVSALVGGVKLYETKNPPRVTLTEGSNATSVTLTRVAEEPETQPPDPQQKTGNLTITVVGANNEFNSFAVTLTDTSTNTQHNGTAFNQTTTTANTVTLSDIPIGTYNVAVKALRGNDTYSGSTTVTVNAGENACTVNVTQDVLPTLSGEITATAGGTQLSKTDTTIIPTSATVTFRYGGTDVTPTITVSGLPSGVTQNGAPVNNNTATGSGAVTLTFGTATRGTDQTITVTASANNYTDKTETFKIKVESIAIGDLTASDGIALPTTNYGSRGTTYLVGTDVMSLRVTLNAGNTTYTGNDVIWSVSTNGQSIIGNSASNTGTLIFTLDDLTTEVYRLDIAAEVGGVRCGSGNAHDIIKFANSGNITLENTVTINSGSLTITPSSTVTIIPPARESAFDIGLNPEGNISTLTLGGHVVIDGQNESRSSPLVNVKDYGVLNLIDNATLQNNEGGFGGGVFVERSGMFTMTGGEISGNTASKGGDVHVWSSGTFRMDGGTISNNKANDTGGGVYIETGTFTDNSGRGSITGNTAAGAGPNHYIKSGVIYNGEKQTTDIID